MARKTGKAVVKAKQQMRAAKLAKHKRELVGAGVELSLPKPSAETRKQREEELKRLYLEFFPRKAEGEQDEQAKQPPGQEQQPEQKEEGQPADGEQLEQQEQPEQIQAEQKEQVEQQERADKPQEKQEAQ
jgi:hypothetical protein